MWHWLLKVAERLRAYPMWAGAALRCRLCVLWWRLDYFKAGYHCGACDAVEALILCCFLLLSVSLLFFANVMIDHAEETKRSFSLGQVWVLIYVIWIIHGSGQKGHHQWATLGSRDSCYALIRPSCACWKVELDINCPKIVCYIFSFFCVISDVYSRTFRCFFQGCWTNLSFWVWH